MLRPVFFAKYNARFQRAKQNFWASGGIGRRAGFRIQYRKVCGFDSRLAHHIESQNSMSDKENQDSPEETTAVATVEEDVEEANVPEDESLKFVEDPTFEVDYKGDCAYEVKTVVPAANIKHRMSEMYDELEEEAQLPGFRRGKAPRALVERKLSKAVRNEVTEKLVGAAFQKLIKDEELHPLSVPAIEGLDGAPERTQDDPLTFTFKFEVAPRCTLGEYKGLSAERPVLSIADEDVNEALDSMRERYAMYETVESAAKDGDQVVVDFKGEIDGEAFAGGAAESYPYIVGSGRFFKEFEEVLVGSQATDELKCQVPFPADYSQPTLAGKTADFTITVHEVKRKALPEIDDAFATEAGFESEADMREKVRADLRAGADAQSTRVVESRLLDQVIEKATFELPKTLVAESAHTYFEQEMRRLMSLRTPIAELNEREEAIRAEALENAIREIKKFVAINEIGRVEECHVTEEDFDKEASAITERSGMDMDVVRRFLSQSDQRDEYASRIFRQKALAVLTSDAKITDKEVSRERLEEEDEAAES